ncbi:MAG TPA: hypothetical protein VFR37_02115, partial [Longimicrobium sp.]|nr:hypothetical protein [Longimicrobium sp.]
MEAPVRPRTSRDGHAPDPSAVALAFASIPLLCTPEQAAQGCVEAVRTLTGDRVRVEVPTRPVPLGVGDPREGLVAVARFAAPGGEGELLCGHPLKHWPAASREALEQQVARLWALHQHRAGQALELDQLRFHLTALQQVARTLAVVRGAEETERLVLDSVGEVFFAWWAALYHTDGEQYTCRAVRSLRGESVAYAIPSRVVRAIASPGQPPVIPPEDAEIRDHVPAEVAVVAPLDFGEGDAGLLILGRRMTDAPYEPHDLALLRALADS